MPCGSLNIVRCRWNGLAGSVFVLVAGTIDVRHLEPGAAVLALDHASDHRVGGSAVY